MCFTYGDGHDSNNTLQGLGDEIVYLENTILFVSHYSVSAIMFPECSKCAHWG